MYTRLQGRTALRLREDFCGTALLCATWVKRSAKHAAEGFDLDADTLAWGLAHNIEPLGKVATRVALHMKDVRAPGRTAPDIRIAQNFSYSIFKRRDELLEYFVAARKSLAKHGIFALDIFDDLLHFASATWALIAAWLSRRASIIFLQTFGTLYLLDGALGLATGSGYLDLGILRYGVVAMPFGFKILANLPHIFLGGVAVISGFLLPRWLSD